MIRSMRIILSGLWVVAAITSAMGQDPVSDPVPSIQTGELEVRLTEFATVPQSSFARPFARINMLRELPDGSGRLAVNDLNGPFYLILEDTAVHEYLNLEDYYSDFQYSDGKGSGFGGFAFHPEFATNGLFYTTHSEEPNGDPVDFESIEHEGIAVQWVLTEWQADDPTLNQFSGSRQEMIRWDFPTVIHGVQEIVFNPHASVGDEDYGLLYICIGEGGSGLNRLHANMQNLSSHLGTIWRIDPLGTNGRTGHYGIPSGNPFVNMENARGEIWAYGFRNPHRVHFERVEDGVKLFTGDIGELNIEEVNLVTKGGNYGWDRREGTFLFDIEKSRETLYELPENDPEAFIYPVAQYDHGDGLAINLGHVYHSGRVEAFEGIFFMGDIPTGKIWYAPVDSLKPGRQFPLLEARTFNSLNEEMPLSEIVDHSRVDIKFGFDSRGEVYFLSKANGTIYTIDVPGTGVIDTTTVDPPALSTSTPPQTTVYPTRVSRELVVNSTSEADMSIISIQGKLLSHHQISKGMSRLDMTDLQPGVYIAIFTSDQGRSQHRFIKLKH